MVIVKCYILCAVFVLYFYDWQYWFVYTSIVTHEQGCVLWQYSGCYACYAAGKQDCFLG